MATRGNQAAGSDANFVVETHSIDVIPASARHGRPRDLFPMWFGANFQITIVFSGGFAIFNGLSLVWTVVAVLLGLTLGGALMAFHSAQGPHLGLPQMIQSRAQFGYFGANLPLIIAVIMYLGFSAAGTVLGAEALRNITGLPIEAGIPIIAVGILALTVLGYRAIHAFEKVLTVIGGIAFVGLTAAILTTSGDSEISSPTVIGEGAGFVLGPFLLVLALCAVLLLSYGPYVADYSRYLPASTPTRSTFWYTFAGAVSSCFWLIVLGAVLQNRYPNMGVVDQVQHVTNLWIPGFEIVMMLVVVIGIIGVNALNAYGAFMSSATIVTTFTKGEVPASKRFRILFIVPVVIVATFLAYLQKDNLLDSWQNLLGFLLYFLIPWTAINLADFYLVRRGRYNLEEITKRDGVYGKWSGPGLIAFFVGCAAQIPFVVTGFFVGPLSALFDGGDISWIIGILVSGSLYILLARRANLAKTASENESALTSAVGD